MTHKYSTRAKKKREKNDDGVGEVVYLVYLGGVCARFLHNTSSARVCDDCSKYTTLLDDIYTEPLLSNIYVRKVSSYDMGITAR